MWHDDHYIYLNSLISGEKIDRMLRPTKLERVKDTFEKYILNLFKLSIGKKKKENKIEQKE